MRKRGFTGIEIIVAIAVLGVVLVGVSIWHNQQSLRGNARSENVVNLPVVSLTVTPVVLLSLALSPVPGVSVSAPTIEQILITWEPVAPQMAATPTATPVFVPTAVPTATPVPTDTPMQSPTSTPTPVPPTPTPSCYSNISPTFTYHITDIGRVNYVVPPPTIGAGPSLKTHSYIGTDGVNVPVYAPVAMTLKAGAHYVGGPYTIDFAASCEVTVRFGHITNPVSAITDLLPATPQSGSQTQELSPIAFAAGELIGYTTGTDVAGNWDFGVYNSATTNRYADDPSWNNSVTYTTAICPFAYFTQSLKSDYYARFDAEILGGNPPDGETFCL